MIGVLLCDPASRSAEAYTVNPSPLEEEGSYASYTYGKAGIKNRIWCCRAWVGPFVDAFTDSLGSSLGLKERHFFAEVVEAFPLGAYVFPYLMIAEEPENSP